MSRSAQIDVSEVESGLFDVVVDEFVSARSFRITLKDSGYSRLAKGRSKVVFIQDAFRFLLMREPKESILGSFDIADISTYFPEFEKEI